MPILDRPLLLALFACSVRPKPWRGDHDPTYVFGQYFIGGLRRVETVFKVFMVVDATFVTTEDTGAYVTYFRVVLEVCTTPLTVPGGGGHTSTSIETFVSHLGMK